MFAYPLASLPSEYLMVHETVHVFPGLSFTVDL